MAVYVALRAERHRGAGVGVSEWRARERALGVSRAECVAQEPSFRPTMILE